MRGLNRDTGWFSMLDGEAKMKSAFERGLDPSNFDVSGKQKRALIARRRFT